jgi:site-specific DNA recombinase
VHLFTGYVHCHCGSKMYVPSNSPKYICYRCPNKIGVQDLEDIFHHQLKDFFFSASDVAAYLDKADQVIREKEELVGNLLEEKKKTEREWKRSTNPTWTMR